MLCCGKQKEPFTCEVALLDGSRVTFSRNQNIKITTKGHTLFSSVCEHLNLVERDYFGLKFLDSRSNVHWIDHDKALCNDETFMTYVAGNQCTLLFGVKFYAADPCACKEEVTRYQFFLQLKQDILTSRLPCQWKKAAELSALAIQSEIGDFYPADHKLGYVSEFRFVKNQDERFEAEVARLHAMFKGLVPSSAEMQYLRKCRQLDLYGVELHSAKGAAGMQFMLGISPRGIETFKNKYRIAVYYWPRIELVDFKDRYMKITVKTKQGHESNHNFELLSSEQCRLVWKSVVDHHVFYRLPQNINATWNKKFRYSGRTEAEILQSEVEREEPEVHRGSSKRYPPRQSTENLDEAVSKENVADNNSNNEELREIAENAKNTDSLNKVIEKKGMFSVSDVEQSTAVRYMTPKSERRERNRQLQSLSDTENRNRKHRSHRGRSSGEESDSPSKRRIRSRARQKHNNYNSDASEVSHHRRRRGYYTDSEMGNKVRQDIERNKRRQAQIGSPQSETRSQRRQKRLSREDELARQQLWQHIRRDVVDPADPSQLNDISYTEIKTGGNPIPARRHKHRPHSKRASTASAFSGVTLEEGMVSPLQVTTTVLQENNRSKQQSYGNGHSNQRYKPSNPQRPGKDWDTRTSLSVDDFRSASSTANGVRVPRSHPKKRTPENARRRNNNNNNGNNNGVVFRPVYSQI